MAAAGCPPKKETASLLGVCYDVVEVLVASLACIVLLFTFLFRVVGVEGDSMMDTLYGGDRLILCPALSSPDRGDIVVINRYTDEPLVKRVIGVAGDTLEIDEELHRVRLNGELLDEPYVQYPTPAYDMTGEVAVPEGYVFVMGDHRNDSHDSRCSGYRGWCRWTISWDGRRSGFGRRSASAYSEGGTGFGRYAEYPVVSGHMTRTRRRIQACLPLIDAVAEVVDAVFR